MTYASLITLLEQQVREQDLEASATARDVHKALREEAAGWTEEEVRNALKRLEDIQAMARETSAQARSETAQKSYNRRALKGYRHLRAAHLAQRTRTTA